MHSILRFSKILVLSVCFAIAAGCDSGNDNGQVEGDQPTAELAKVDPDGGTPSAPPGLNPSPAQGKQADNPLFKDFRSADPSPFVHDGRFYIVCGEDREVTGGYDFLMPSWRLLSSDDMINWKYYGEILRPDQVSWMPKDRAWASDIIYRNGYFYFYISNDLQVDVLRSKNVEGPYEDVLGKPLIDSKTPNHSNRDIDPHCFVDDDGQAYLFWGGDGACRYVKLNDDMISFASDVMKVPGVSGDGYSFLEAPFVIKENGTYFIMFATQPWASEIHYATASTINGPWAYQARIGAATGNGTNHPGAAYFKGQWWYTYHTEELSGGNTSSRCVCVDKMYINGDKIAPVIYSSFWMD